MITDPEQQHTLMMKHLWIAIHVQRIAMVVTTITQCHVCACSTFPLEGLTRLQSLILHGDSADVLLPAGETITSISNSSKGSNCSAAIAAGVATAAAGVASVLLPVSTYIVFAATTDICESMLLPVRELEHTRSIGVLLWRVMMVMMQPEQRCTTTGTCKHTASRVRGCRQVARALVCRQNQGMVPMPAVLKHRVFLLSDVGRHSM
jgi:hypothetical protein